MNCEHGQSTVGTDTQGRAWEHFWIGDRYQFSNQIPNQESWTRTDPGWVLADNGYCQWAGQPPQRIRHFQPQDTTIQTTAQAAPMAAPPPTASNAGMTDGGFGVLVLLAALGAGAWSYANRGREPDASYSPHADLTLSLPAFTNRGQIAPMPDELEIDDGAPIPDGYELIEVGGPTTEPEFTPPLTTELPGEFEVETAQNSDQFGQNSQWPPTELAGPYDPMSDEVEPGEFDLYRKAVEEEGLSPMGSPIITRVWGVKPGSSKKYDAARDRRNMFAKRLRHYNEGF